MILNETVQYHEAKNCHFKGSYASLQTLHTDIDWLDTRVLLSLCIRSTVVKAKQVCTSLTEFELSSRLIKCSKKITSTKNLVHT